jgi:hypothetical protein
LQHFSAQDLPVCVAGSLLQQMCFSEWAPIKEERAQWFDATSQPAKRRATSGKRTV